MYYLSPKLINLQQISHTVLYSIPFIVDHISDLAAVLSLETRAFEGSRTGNSENLKNQYHSIKVYVIDYVCAKFYGRGGVGRWLLGRRRRQAAAIVVAVLLVFVCELCVVFCV